MNDFARGAVAFLMSIYATVAISRGEAKNTIATSVARPPQKAMVNALILVGADVSDLARVYGVNAAFALFSRENDKVWLIAVQAKNKGYCSFVNVSAKSGSATGAGSFVGCQIYRVEFKDFNGDGSIDALYHIKTKSNVADAWVDEEALFISREDGFCKARDGRRFVSSPSEINCE